MVAVVDRAGPLFAPALSVTLPLPVPDAPLVTASHVGSLLTADQLHQLPVVTATVAAPPLPGIVWLAGERAKLQLARCCVAVNASPATESVAVRDAPPFGAALNITVPLPLPETPLVTVSQLWLLVAVHEQVFAALTAIDPVSPPEANVCAVGVI